MIIFVVPNSEPISNEIAPNEGWLLFAQRTTASHCISGCNPAAGQQFRPVGNLSTLSSAAPLLLRALGRYDYSAVPTHFMGEVMVIRRAAATLLLLVATTSASAQDKGCLLYTSDAADEL